MSVQTLIQVRRGTSAEWRNINSTLSAGEWGFETDTRRYKIGDGITSWNSLPYSSILPSSNDLSGISGIGINFTSNSGVPVTIAVTGISSSQVTDFNSSVSGLLPIKSLIAGTNIAVTPTGDQGFIISTNGLDTNAVKDLIGSTISGVSGVAVSYDNTSKVVTVSLSDPSIQSTDVTDFNTAVSGLVDGIYAPLSNPIFTGSVTIPNGTGNFSSLKVNNVNVSVSGHTHVASDITNFNSSVSGLLNVKSLSAGTGIGIVNNNGVNTISVTGIPTSLITNFASGVNTLIENAVSASIVGGSGVDIVYNSGTNTLTISSAITAGSGISLTHNSGNYTIGLSDPTIQLADITDLTSAARTFLLTPSSNNLSSLVTDETGSGALVFANNPTLSGVTVNGTLTAAGNVTIGGNLTVQGTTTTVNSTTVEIGDNIIRVNASGLGTGGLEVVDGVGTQSLVWNSTNSRWEFSGSAVYNSGDFISNSLQVSSTGLVANLNSDLLDGEHGSFYRNFNNLSGIPSPVISGSLTGDITGSSTVTLNSLGNGLLSITTDIAPNTIVDADISPSAAIAVTKLASSGISLGSTTVNLGGSTSIISGLSAISGTSSSSPTTLYYCIIDGGTP